MSTGAECRIAEREPGKWWYEIKRWTYGNWPEYDTKGPFPSEDAAFEHLRRNYANPGGASVISYREDS